MNRGICRRVREAPEGSDGAHPDVGNVVITRLCSAANGSWTGSDRIFCSLSIYGLMWNCLANVQDFALTIYPIFTYFTCYQVEIHGPARSSDVIRVTFACKREYFLQTAGSWE